MKLNWLIPEPARGAGGDVGIFRLIRHLAEFGHDCHVYVVASNLLHGHSDEQVREYVQENFGATVATYHRWRGTVREADATFATFWPTAEKLLTLPNGGRRYYLVQDFEPSFYPGAPGLSERAENSYRAGLRCITLGPWLTRLLRERYKARADHFDFAVDTALYRPRPQERSGVARICYYARPATPRRGYELGLAALGMVKERRPEVEIVFFGAPELNPPPAFPVTQRGRLTEEELAELFSSCDIGVVFSLTNPSFVPLEMMACGCAVVEIASERWEGVLTHGENAWLVPAVAQAIADGIIELLENKPLREKISGNGGRRAGAMSWRESARQIEAILQRDALEPATPRAEGALASRQFEPLRYGLGAWTEHIFFAYDLVAELRPRVLVELGTDRGESYFAFCQSAKENATGTQCYAVDHWRGDPHAGTYDEATFADVSAHHLAHYAAFSTLLRSSFDEALERFSPESIDLLHLDGHHTEEAVRHDLEAWLPKLRPGGIVLLHDIAVRERDFGVWKVWEELRTRGRSFAFAQPPGLGVWEKPPAGAFPPLLEKLFATPNESKAALLGYYHGRHGELHEKMMEQWRDGSIRRAPMASETVIQVFWRGAGGFSEEDSIDARIGHQGWKEVAIPLPARGEVRGLRIDFFSALTIVEIAQIMVGNAAGESVCRLTKKEEFEAISLGGDCVRLSLEPFRIQITGIDPQLHLPEFLPPLVGEGLVVRMRLRVQPQI